VLEQLKVRIARAQQDIAAANPLEGDDSMMARRVIEGPADESLVPGRTTAHVDAGTGADPADRRLVTVCLLDEARTEAARLAANRQLSVETDDRVLESLEAAGTWIATARVRSTRVWLRRRVLAILRVEHEDGQGRVSHWMLVPLAVTVPHLQRRLGQAAVRRILRAIAAQLQAAASTAAGLEGDAAAAVARTLADVRVTRERAIAQLLLQGPLNRKAPGGPRSDLQPGLFDRRAERADLIDRAAIHDASADQAGRIAAFERAAVITARTPRLVLVLLP